MDQCPNLGASPVLRIRHEPIPEHALADSTLLTGLDAY
jgi:hypothetical protein